MCRIERFYLVYPDGFREVKQRLFICRNGALNRPCDQTCTVDTEREFAGSLPEAPQPPPPRTSHVPRHADNDAQISRPRSPHSRLDTRQSSGRSSPGGLRIVARWRTPWGPRKVERNRKGDLVLIRQSARHSRPLEAVAVPPHHPQPPPQILSPPPPPLIELPVRPPPQQPAEVIHQRRTRPASVTVVHHRDESPEMIPLREHHRGRRPTPPPDRLSEVERQLARERSRRRRAEEDAAKAVQNARMSEAERIRSEQDRNRAERDLILAEQEADWHWETNRRREEAERLRNQRAREAREALTRAPRHVSEVHQETGRTFEQRGTDFIRSAISAQESARWRAEDRWRAEEEARLAERDRRREGTDLARRNTTSDVRRGDTWAQYGQDWPRD